MTWEKISKLAQDHPVWLGLAIFAAGLLILWLLGYFTPAQAGGGGTDTGLAQAYYQAEAAQTISGNQLQMATVNDAAAVNVATIQANRDVAMNTANVQGNVSIAGISGATAQQISANQTGAAVQIAGIQGQTSVQNTAATTSAAVQEAAYANNTANTSAYYTYQTAAQESANALTSSITNAYISNEAKLLAPATLGGGVTAVTLTPSGSGYAGAMPSPGYLQTAGYTPAQNQQLISKFYGIAGG